MRGFRESRTTASIARFLGLSRRTERSHAVTGLRDNQLGKDEAIDHYQDLYQVNYEEGHRALDDQQDALNGIRDRAVQFTVFVGAATAFLVGSGLQSPHRDAFFYAIAWVASAASALSVSLLFLVLNPSRRNKWAYRLSTKVLNRELEADAPTSKAYYFKKMAGMYDEMRESNEILLRSMRVAYRWLMIVGSAQVTIWAALIWAGR